MHLAAPAREPDPIRLSTRPIRPTTIPNYRSPVIEDTCPRRKCAGQQHNLAVGAEISAAMIDRLVHHAEVISMKGDSYRLKDRDLGRVPAAKTND
ncbi:ATP-binding protein [Nocardia sp. CA-119907]|uniref:ATP-binding protein n=1 Tax=Nocardia sp. CA-119907 TaxID=3239973 RepID=UPI003D9942E4